jgi:pyruvate ferredoxin oxidoreductase alpha subunit
MAKTGTKVAMTGNTACAEAMRQIDPDVVAAYPITPQTAIVEDFSNFVASGKVSTEFVCVESEHSAMSSCIGAAAAGARVMTATASQGLALMWEMLYVASALRLPIVMHNVNRTLSAPINIHCDHSDSMGARDAGWIQLFSENAQEAYDNTIQAIRIAEDPSVYLPVMVLLDGFIISHAIDRLEILEDNQVKEFVGEISPPFSLINAEEPIAVGPFDGLHGYYFEFKTVQNEALLSSKKTILEVGKEYKNLSGRGYDLFEPYRLDDAEAAIVVLGSTAGTARIVVDELRSEGRKVGLLKLRVFRPFPAEELSQALGNLKAVAAMDRSCSFGALGGPVFTEVRAALYGNEKQIPIAGYIYGLGGRDVGKDQIHRVFSDLLETVKTGKSKDRASYLGIRE